MQRRPTRQRRRGCGGLSPLPHEPRRSGLLLLLLFPPAFLLSLALFLGGAMSV
jgi:hypothetical protein